MSHPEELPEDGILLGYSLEHERHTPPIGFMYGSREYGSEDGYMEPILMTGSGHLITVAPTGAGKGVGCIIPTLLRFRGPVIVVDPKGENYAVTAERRRELGQKVVLLDPLGITDADEVDSLNPLDLIDPSHPQAIEDTAMLAKLLGGGIEKHDPENLFWYQRGEQVLMALIQHVAIAHEGRKRTLAEVRHLINLPFDQLQQIAGTTLARSPDANVRILAGILTNPSPETTGSIMSMAQNNLEFLRGGLVEHSLRQSTLDLLDVTAGEPLSIYIVIPPDKLDPLRGLLRVWIGTLMSAIMRRRYAPPHRTLFILDEAAQLGTLDQLRQAVTLMRGYGLQTWSFWQDLSQLQNLYPRDWLTMCNNSRVQQAFGFMSLKAAEAACDLMGFYDVHEALHTDSSEMLLSVAGDETVIARKPNYLTDEAFEGFYADNPFYKNIPEGPPEPRKPPRWYVRRDPRIDPLRDAVQRARSGREAGAGEAEVPARQRAPAGGSASEARSGEGEAPERSRPADGPGPFSGASSLVRGPEAPGWEPVGEEEHATLLAELQAHLERPLPGPAILSRIRLRCYPGHDLLRIATEGEDGWNRGYAFYAPGRLVPLDWEASTLHRFNGGGALQVTTAEDAREYLRFFSWSIRGDQGRWFITERLEDIPFRAGGELDPEQRDTLTAFLQSVRRVEAPPEQPASFGFLAPVLYDAALYLATFGVNWRGHVTMNGDHEVEGLRDAPIRGDDLDEGGYFVPDVT